MYRRMTDEMYKKVIKALTDGLHIERQRRVEVNIPVATALQVQANVGFDMKDVLALRNGDIQKDKDGCFWIDKTGRRFIVPPTIDGYLHWYCEEFNIGKGERLFNFTSQFVDKLLKRICAYYGYEKLSPIDFRRYFGMRAYEETHNIETVRQLYCHADKTITRRFLGIKYVKDGDDIIL